MYAHVTVLLKRCFIVTIIIIGISKVTMIVMEIDNLAKEHQIKRYFSATVSLFLTSKYNSFFFLLHPKYSNISYL